MSFPVEVFNSFVVANLLLLTGYFAIKIAKGQRKQSRPFRPKVRKNPQTIVEPSVEPQPINDHSELLQPPNQISPQRKKAPKEVSPQAIIKLYPPEKQITANNLIKSYFDLFKRKDTLSEYSSTRTPESSQVIRADPIDENYFMIALDIQESVAPQPDDFKRLYANGYVEKLKHVNDRTLITKSLSSGNGGLETFAQVVDVRMIFIANRIIVNSLYAFWEYEGRPNEHLLIMSTGRKDNFIGLIYRSTQKPMQPTEFSATQTLPLTIEALTDVGQKLCTIEGSWLHNLTFDGEKTWDIEAHAPQRQLPHEELYRGGRRTTDIVMPSGWRYREDLIWLKYGFQEPAAAWKLKLEIQQRKDKSSRAGGEKRRKR